MVTSIARLTSSQISNHNKMLCFLTTSNQSPNNTSHWSVLDHIPILQAIAVIGEWNKPIDQDIHPSTSSTHLPIHPSILEIRNEKYPYLSHIY